MGFRKYVLLLLITLTGNISYTYSQENPAEPFYVKVPRKNISKTADLPGTFHREDIRRDSIRIMVTKDQYNSLKQQYPGTTILKASIALGDNDMAANFDEALTMEKYPTYDQYVEMMHYFADTYPEICKIDTIGKSIQNRLILVLKISDNVKTMEDEPSFFYTSTIHGDELVGYNLTLRFIDFLLSNYAGNTEVQQLVDEVEIWVNPLSNPDGTYYPDNSSSVAMSVRENANWYDLNRNYPDVVTGVPENNAPIQPETQQMIDFMTRERFNISANLHSGAEVVNYPWDFTYNLHNDDSWLILISREYADEARVYNSSYMDGFTDGITNGADWYRISGGRQDYVTYYLQGRELTLELSNTKKILAENLATYWTYNKWSMFNLVSQTRYGIHGKVTSAASGIPLGAQISIENHDDSSSWVSSDTIFGSFYRYIKEGTYDLVVSSEGYINDTVKDVAVFDYEKTELNIQLDSVVQTGMGRREFFSFQVYPNPAKNIIYIRPDNPSAEKMPYMIYDTPGKIVSSGFLEPGKSHYTIQIAELPAGIFHLKIISGEKEYIQSISKY